MKAKIKAKISYDDCCDDWEDWDISSIDYNYDWWDAEVDYEYTKNCDRYPYYREIDMMSFYKKDELRNKKLEILFNNSNNKTTLGDFCNIKK